MLGLLPGSLIAALADQPAAAPGAGSPKASPVVAPPAEKPAPPSAKPAEKAAPVPPSATKAPPPVIVSLSGDKIVIASQDREALDQMESLLRVMARQSGGPSPGAITASTC